MKTILAASLSFAVLGILSCSHSQDDMTNDSKRQNHFETTTDEQRLEKYVEESKKLDEEFTPIWERLRQEDFIARKHGTGVDIKKWETEYFRPLFEKSRQAMIRITGKGDYLDLWENHIFLTMDQELPFPTLPSELEQSFEGIF
jgi:hypothetical protein